MKNLNFNPLFQFILLFSFYGNLSLAIELPSTCILISPISDPALIIHGSLIEQNGEQGLLVLKSRLPEWSFVLAKVTCAGVGSLPNFRSVAGIKDLPLEEGTNPDLQLSFVTLKGRFPSKLVVPLPTKGTPVPASLSIISRNGTLIPIRAETGGKCEKFIGQAAVCVSSLLNGPNLSDFGSASLPLFDTKQGILFGLGSGKTFKELKRKDKDEGHIGILIDENTLVFVQPPSI